MAEIKPLKGLRYNTQKVKPEDVITLPYDKIGPDLQKDYYTRSPYNLVRIILGLEDPGDSDRKNKYTRARDFFAAWQKEEVLLPEGKEAIYVYDQHYSVPGTDEKKVRRSFIALGKLEEYASRKVLPHERTLSKPKADRLNLLRATELNCELIFMLYDDPQAKVNQLLEKGAAGKPLYDFTDVQQTRNCLWAVTDPKLVSEIQAQIKDKTLIIADGHHRYETALNYKKEKGIEYALMAFVNQAAPGLTVLPTHRLVKNLPKLDKEAVLKKCAEHFSIEKLAAPADLFAKMKNGTSHHTLGAYFPDKSAYLLRLKGSGELDGLVKKGIPKEVASLDVAILHNFVIEGALGLTQESVAREENISYYREKEKVVKDVDAGKFQGAFFLNPTTVQEVQQVCHAGHVLPQKSTDFFPKLLSGLVFYKF